MQYNRRLFLKNAGFATLGAAALPLVSCSTGTTGNSAADTTAVAGDAPDRRISTFGVQLYSARDIIGKDPKGVLKQLAELGYREIEGYQGDQGVFWSMTPREF